MITTNTAIQALAVKSGWPLHQLHNTLHKCLARPSFGASVALLTTNKTALDTCVCWQTLVKNLQLAEVMFAKFSGLPVLRKLEISGQDTHAE